MSDSAKIDRRSFVVGAASIVGGIAIGYYPVHKPLAVSSSRHENHESYPNPLEAEPGKAILNPYLIIDQRGYTIITPRAEMGQGIHSTLAAMVAEELDVPWEHVSAISGPAAKVYYNSTIWVGLLPIIDYEEETTERRAAVAASQRNAHHLALQVTGGSSNVQDGFVKMRQAGAVARLMLLEAAAAKWDIDSSVLTTNNGFVLDDSGRRLSYLDLAADAASLEPPGDPALKPGSEWRYLGKSMPRLDIPSKVDGSAEFGLDKQLDGMLYAAVKMGPRSHLAVKSFDGAKVLKMPGVIKIVDVGNGVAAVAKSTWQAMQAAKELAVEWEPSDLPSDMDGIYNQLAKAFDNEPNKRIRNRGDANGVLKHAETIIKSEYRVPYVPHAAMEPMNATALYTNRALEVWTGNQVPTNFQKEAAQIAGLELAQVKIHSPLMGGAFGRRTETDASNQAVKLAMTLPGIPVKLTWTRENDMQHDFYRPAAIARMEGAVDADGVTVFKGRVAAQSIQREQGRRLLGPGHTLPSGPERPIVEGMYDQPYKIPNYLVEGYPFAELPIEIGVWRSVGNSHNAFFHESFIDELAVTGGFDPLELRLELLKDEHEPSRKVVEAVAEMANWGGKVAANVGRGIAFTYSYGAATAQIVEVSQTDGGIKLENVWCAMDVGTALDPEIIDAQIRSAIIFGLSAAISGEITFSGGAVEQSNFHDQPVIRMSGSPIIQTKILENQRHLSGVGEPATPPAAPALANAIFDLTGTRIRTLPFTKHLKFIT
ncbi:MAG: molybdopterin cofactor-binding domain-containing protein [Halioglobus sp.]